MKRVLKIVLIAFASVIGAFGIVLGTMYLLGSFNEKIVYAENLSFEEQEVVSAETFFMKVNTTTDEVTKKTVRLVSNAGGDRIIDFPSEVTIGEIFQIIPKTSNGVNVGGNVRLTAYYDDPSADPSVRASCDILIDIPITKADVTMSTVTLKPNNRVSICQAGSLVSSAINIEPQFSLVPYMKSGTKTIEEVVDKSLFLELSDGNRTISPNIAKFIDGEGNDYSSNVVEVKYSYNSSNQLVFDNTIVIASGNTQQDVYLKVYAYSTYDAQKRDLGTGEVVLNTNNTLNSSLTLTIGNYQIDGMTIFNDTTTIVTKEIYLYEDTKLYINNSAVETDKNEINLGIKLSASESANIDISKIYYRDNIYINVSNTTYRTLSKWDNSTVTTSSYGLNMSCDGLPDTLDSWYWNFTISSFYAYFDYQQNDQVFEVTLTYHEGSTDIECRFYIIPRIYEVDSLSVNYASGDSFYVSSGDSVNLGSQLIKVNPVSNLPSGKQPTFSELAYYISLNKNYSSKNSETTVSTVPTQPGNYKLTFSFTLRESTNNILIAPATNWCDFSKIVLRQGNTEYTINYSNGQPSSSTTNLEAETIIYAEIYLSLKSNPLPTATSPLFYINTTLPIMSRGVKFFESVGTDAYSSYPYLTIDNVRYYIYFDFYTGTDNMDYLKIDNQVVTPETYVVQGIGQFYVTAQLVYNDTTNNITFWLGKSVDVDISVYEDLETLYAYKYASSESFNEAFGQNISYNENDGERKYIFITSDELESLKNYVAFDQIDIFVGQYFGDLNTSLYNGLATQNSGAIEFVSPWTEVTVNGRLQGYYIAYIINDIYSISINDTFLDNLFRIQFSVKVNGEDVYATFINSTTDEELNTDYLQFEVVDKTLTGAVLKYNTNIINNGATRETAIDLQIRYANNGVDWYGFDANDISYFFTYKDGDTKGVIDAMTYNAEILDGPVSNAELAGMYGFTAHYDTEKEQGIGGLTFGNFPQNLDDSDNNKGVLVRFYVYSADKYAFNSHLEWNSLSNSFVTVQNDNLMGELYFRIYGFSISVEVNTDEAGNLIQVDGFEDNEVPVFGANGLFKITVFDGNNNSVDTTAVGFDFSKLMDVNVDVNNSEVELSDDFSTLKVLKDYMSNGNAVFRFYVAGSRHIIGIHTSVSSQMSYSQTISSAFVVETAINFEAPSRDVTFATITYKKDAEGEDSSVPSLLNVSIELVSENATITIPDGDVIIVNPDGTLTFLTVPEQYTAEMKLTLSRIGDDDDKYEMTKTIYVSPVYSTNEIQVGNWQDPLQEGEAGYYYLTAGQENALTSAGSDAKIKFTGELLDTIFIQETGLVNTNIISNVVVEFSNKDEDDNLLLASAHMGYTYTGGVITIYSYDINYDKEVEVTITLEFAEGGKFIAVKTIKVLHNLDLTLVESASTINLENPITLTLDTNYTFKRAGEVTTLWTSGSFDYNGTDGYNKDSFKYDSKYFRDTTGSNTHNFVLTAQNTTGVSYPTKVKSTIEFKYITTHGYTLTFNLEITVVLATFSNENLILGTADTDYRYMSGSSSITTSGTNGGILYAGGLASIADYISNVEAEITNLTEGESLNAIEFITFNFNTSTKVLTITANTNVAKKIRVHLMFKFKDANSVEEEHDFVQDLVITATYANSNIVLNNGEALTSGHTISSSDGSQIAFGGQLATDLANGKVSDVKVEFEQVDINVDTTEMTSSYDASTKVLEINISNQSVNTAVRLIITATFTDSTTAVFTKTLQLVANEG